MNKIKQTPAQGINIIESGNEATEEIEATCNHLNKIFQEEIDREQLKDTAQVEMAKIWQSNFVINIDTDTPDSIRHRIRDIVDKWNSHISNDNIVPSSGLKCAVSRGDDLKSLNVFVFGGYIQR